MYLYYMLVAIFYHFKDPVMIVDGKMQYLFDEHGKRYLDCFAGIVTVSAQFFELDGLSELALGGVRLGGSGTVVNEFSTDPTFGADSNNVIPTQRAIATFLANRLSVGGENLEVNRLVAGRIGLGGSADVIENTTGEYLVIPTDVVFNGVYTDDDELEQPTGIQGTIISQMLFLKGFEEGMQ